MNEDIIKNANVKNLEDAIINLGVAQYIFEFAVNVPKANINRLGNALLRLKNVKYITYFTMNFNINVPEAQAIIVESKNPKYICLFASYVVGADIKILEDTIISIGDARFIFEFAIKVPNANVNRLLQAFIKNVDKEDYALINDFADELDRENLRLLKNSFPEAFIIKILTRTKTKI